MSGSKRRAYPQPQYVIGNNLPNIDNEISQTKLRGDIHLDSNEEFTQNFQRMNMNSHNNGIKSNYARDELLVQGDYNTNFMRNQNVNFGYGNNYYDSTKFSSQMNQLYTTDLSRELPPQISDLKLPPPLINLPSNICLNQNLKISNANPNYLRLTLNVIPTTSSLLKKSKLPLALIIRPYNFLKVEDEPIETTCDTTVCRCRRCRGYINPFVTLIENGRRWRCNFCNMLNDIASAFEYNHLTGAAKNKFERVELNYSTVEFLAPKEYMSRSPQPIVYVFIIDVSINSITNGLTSTVTRTILECLNDIPDINKTAKVAFIGVDTGLHFFKFNETNNDINHLIISDVDDPFLPSPDGLLVNLSENRTAIEKLLIEFFSYFENTAIQGFALGPALKSGHKIINNIGGKLTCFCSSLPSIGDGKSSIKDESSILGKSKNSKTLFSNIDNFFKSFAVTCSSSQTTVDLFLCSSSYQNVLNLSNLPRYTAGQTYYYPGWNGSKIEDVKKLSSELNSYLSQDITLEAVFRLRGSSGLKMNSYFGNFFKRSTDLCSFPTFSRDQSYCIEVSIEDNITVPIVYFQAAVLHSTSYGERRIRVINLAIPTSNNLSTIYASADQLAICNYFTHKAVEKAYLGTLQDSRNYLIKMVIEILVTYKKDLVSGNISGSSPLQICKNLRILPLLLFSLNKHPAFRSDSIPTDHRAIALNNLGSMPLKYLIPYIYPNIYSLHNMSDECGFYEKMIQINEETGEQVEIQTNNIVIPDPINNTKLIWENYGLYLIDNHTELFLWVSGGVVPGLISDLFGVDDLYSVPTGKTEIPILTDDESEFNFRVRMIINKLREHNDSIVWKSLYIVIGGSPNEPVEISQKTDLIALRMWSHSFLVEDKVGPEPSYRDFLNSIKNKISQ